MKTDEPKHPMGVVTRKTGLRADVIRAWERRHQAIVPTRTPGNRRLYSDRDIQRLLLIRKVLRSGWQIGQVAALDDKALRELIEDETPVAELTDPRAVETGLIEQHLRRALTAVSDLDGDRLRSELEASSVTLSRFDLLERLIVPLVTSLGDSCEDGRLRTAHEHLTTTVLRSFLDNLRGAYPPSEDAPGIVVTTPSHQHHELGSILVAATARGEGWRTTLLGPNLPAEEVAAAAAKRGARVVALGITFPGDDPRLAGELRKLRRLLPENAVIIAGGRSSGAYESVLREIGAERLDSLADFRACLAQIRAGARTRAVRVAEAS